MKFIFFSFFLSLTTIAAPLKLALNWKAEPQFGGFYAAQILGEFKKQGLDVEIIEGGSGTPTVQMLANKKVDFAVVNSDEIIISQERNPKNLIVALFATYQINPQIIMLHESRNFRSLKELFQNDGVLALQSGLSYSQYLVNKFQPIKVRLVPYQGGISHLLGHNDYSQQGFATSEPLLAKKAGLKIKTFLVADEGYNPYTTVLAVHENRLKDKVLVKKFVTAVQNGWAAYLKDPTLTNQKMAQINKAMDPETFKESVCH